MIMNLQILMLLLCFWQSVAGEDEYKDMSNKIMEAIKEKIDRQWNDFSIDSSQLPSDFDDETEKLMKIMDWAEKFFNESNNQDDEDEDEDAKGDEIEDDADIKAEENDVLPGKNGKDRKSNRKAKKLSRKLARKEQKLLRQQLRKQDSPSKSCLSMEERIDRLCKGVMMVKNNPMMAELYAHWTKKTNGRGGWNECCSAQDEKQRLVCFQVHKQSLQKKLCEKKKEKFASCCELIGDKQYECFDNYNAQKCLKDNMSESDNKKKEHVDPKLMTKLVKADKQRKVSEKNEMKKNNRKSKPYKAGKLQSDDKHAGEKCCAAGLKEGKHKSGTVDLCEKKYNLWSADKIDLPSTCADKYVECCINSNQEKKPKRPQSELTETDKEMDLNVAVKEENKAKQDEKPHKRPGRPPKVQNKDQDKVVSSPKNEKLDSKQTKLN